MKKFRVEVAYKVSQEVEVHAEDSNAAAESAKAIISELSPGHIYEWFAFLSTEVDEASG